MFERPSAYGGCSLKPVIGVAISLSIYDGNWPGTGFPRGRRKLASPGRAIAPEVSFLARPRIHSDGHQPSLTVGHFAAN